jgi:hypothetical protein
MKPGKNIPCNSAADVFERERDRQLSGYSRDRTLGKGIR